MIQADPMQYMLTFKTGSRPILETAFLFSTLEDAERVSASVSGQRCKIFEIRAAYGIPIDHEECLLVWEAE